MHDDPASGRAIANARTVAMAAASLTCFVACGPIADVLCDEQGCRFSKEEFLRLESLANLGVPPADASNRYVGNPLAERLGQRFYFDPRFSGASTLKDTLGRPQPFGRAPKGEPSGISCATCHDPSRGGTDHTSSPNHVSMGAGLYDVNSQPTRNAAYYDLTYWNARNDSLWAQIVAVVESPVSMNGSRLRIARLIRDHYANEYAALFPEYPIPFDDTTDALLQRLLPSGQCRLVPSAANPGGPDVCPTDQGCVVELSADGVSNCWPRFSFSGKPGKVSGCQRGSGDEPFQDAFDCMTDADQKSITRIYVNFAKAIAAYEYLLVSKNSAFDRFVNAGPESTGLSDEAIRGARLFVGKAACVDCHRTPLFSDNFWHNVGVPQIGHGVPTEEDCIAGSACDCIAGVNCLPWGIYNGLKLLKTNKVRRDSTFSDDPADGSRKRIYDLELVDSMKGAWRTPGLRDVALTAPYMHDGAYATLLDVIQHYNRANTSRGSFSGSPSVQFKPLGLTPEEELDLVEFLRSLTGEPLPSELLTAPPAP